MTLKLGDIRQKHINAHLSLNRVISYSNFSGKIIYFTT